MTGGRDLPRIVAMGVASTGKSVIGKRVADGLGIDFVEGDSYHPQENIDKMSEGTPLDDTDRRPWLETLAGLIGDHEDAGTAVLVTCSALKRSYRDILRSRADDLFFLHLDADFEVLAERMEQRTGHFMPPSLLQSQLDTLEPLGADECGARVDVAPPVDEVVAASLEAIDSRPQG